jgi:hypothetical protein
VNFFAICEAVSQEGLGSGEVKLKLLDVAIYLQMSCGQPSHLSDSTAICLPSTFGGVCHVSQEQNSTVNKQKNTKAEIFKILVFFLIENNRHLQPDSVVTQ